ncbi:L-arabinose isomerase [Pseudobythopirellula maris]|uniref:L-arabinose isomerase n=1 Tax=Pseudobythopirellula maris TaxID=2527991 RepID=A0A5C5ZJ82_9BACT|nr:L-arabinose isomerase [Pseudobythopirellula maris]TWT87409.1 L-arabinose isomerase [Pseudobythopirellula maris]
MPLPDLTELEVWFVTGSQHLYGPETLEEVAAHSKEVAAALGASPHVPVKVVFKPVLVTPESILEVVQQANNAPNCIGLVAWMHTFSPAKMWIAGLTRLQKPLAHLHTQFGREIPWSTIDMDFMNTNQSAHGGREFGFIGARLRMERKVIVGHWQDDAPQKSLGVWCRAAAARHDLQTAKIARFGDNMREVAVTEGDKVAAQIALGVSVHGYGVGDLVERIDAATEAQVDALCSEYDTQYAVAADLGPKGSRREALRDTARIELGLRSFLEEGGFAGFTDTFENLHGMKQLPGLPTQRLMADGYGFGGEGDWKASLMTRASKVMAAGLPGGTSFMEDYTYHLPAGGEARVLGSHMLEICPTIAADKPSCEIHPLGIGGKEDPVRLVFDAPAGPAVNATIIDLGDRFRFVLNEVEVVDPEQPLPKLPVARALWKPLPDMPTAAAAWIYAGGSHHPTFSQALTTEHYEDLASMLGIELLVIDTETRLREFRHTIRMSDAAGVYSRA